MLPWKEEIWCARGVLGTEIRSVPSNSKKRVDDWKTPGLAAHRTLPLGRGEAGPAAMARRAVVQQGPSFLVVAVVLAGAEIRPGQGRRIEHRRALVEGIREEEPAVRQDGALGIPDVRPVRRRGLARPPVGERIVDGAALRPH